VASVIAGVTSPEQVWTKVEATKWQLLDKDLTEIDRITRDLAA
jgi:aryl-alcohol dehydrogenase-like predicted oxidoreductase